MSTDTFTSLRPAVAAGLLQRVRASRWAPLPVVLAGTFMVVLDFFIVNVALPSIQSGLHASTGSIEWIVAGYGLTTAVLLITSGRLGDRYGRRRVFTVGLALFTLSSAACGFASDATVLVGARLVQGCGAALLMPNVLSLIGVLYDGADRARALAAYGITMGLAAVSGQLIGGVLMQADPAGLSWRSCFLINVPIGALAVALAPRAIPESRAPRTGALDLLGTLLVTGALVAIVLPLVQGRADGWPLWTWLSLASAPAILAAFWRQQRRLAQRGGTPLLTPDVFSARHVRSGLVAQLVFWCGQASFFLVLALYMQLGRGMSALSSGLVFTIMAVSYLATSMPAPTLTERYGRRVLTVGSLTLAAGHLALLAAVASVGVGGSVVVLVPGLILIGAGMGLGITPLTTIIMTGMKPEHAGGTAGVLATAQNVGNALGVAVVGVVFFGAASQGFAYAFELSLGVLAAILIVVAVLSRVLPAGVRS
ncbi:MAG: MFS transporter [Solirubrobacteraceae bacterium]